MIKKLTLLLSVALWTGATQAMGGDPPTSESSSSSETHVPSAGITVDVLKTLPPPYNRYMQPANPTVVYAPTYIVTPTYGFGYYPYGFRRSGLGGYYPQGAGGRYNSRIGFFLWY